MLYLAPKSLAVGKISWLVANIFPKSKTALKSLGISALLSLIKVKILVLEIVEEFMFVICKRSERKILTIILKKVATYILLKISKYAIFTTIIRSNW